MIARLGVLAGIGVTIIVVGWFVAPRPPFDLDATVRLPSFGFFGVVGAPLILCAVGFAVVAMRVLGWRERVRMKYPKAMVILCQRTSTLEPAMRRARLPFGALGVPAYFPLAFDSTGVRIGLRAEADHLIPWSRILSIDVGRSFATSGAPAVTITVSAEYGDRELLHVIPCRPGWELRAIVDIAKTRELANEMNAHRPKVRRSGE